MSDYLQSVLQASGGAAAPEEVLYDTENVEDSEAQVDEDPCWSGYEQIGMKEKGDKKVPNCVPAASTIDFLIDEVNADFGASRRITKEDAYAVARKACDKYSHLADDEDALYSAILWELHVFSEYATVGASDATESFSLYEGHLPEGHPSIESTLAASAAWVAGAPELDNSGREALLNAFSDGVDYVKSLHANTRVRAMVSSGSLANSTLQYIKNLSDKYSKVS